MYEFLSPEDWQAFEKRWPDAHYFLLHRSLSGELSARRKSNCGCSPEWNAQRLAELERWNEFIRQIDPAKAVPDEQPSGPTSSP